MTAPRATGPREIRLDMQLDERLRQTLGRLADVLIPSGGAFPSASRAGVAGELVDQVLRSRPDLIDELVALLQDAQGRDPDEVIAELRDRDPAAFSVLATIVPGAYFSSPEVRQRLGYQGQRPKPMDEVVDLDDDLLQSVIDRGPIYRPTPDLHVVIGVDQDADTPAR